MAISFYLGRMIYFFAYLAGLLTLINPCILPVLPIVLASALQAHKRGPLALAAGMTIAFVTFGVGIAVIGQNLGLSSDDLARAGAWAMVAFGVVLLVPQFAQRLELAAAGMAAHANAGINQVNQSTLIGQALTGALLGAVWSPCVGPTLGGAIALSYQGESLIHAAAIMLVFALGVSTVILALAYGLRWPLHDRVRNLARWSGPIMGLALLIVGVGILSGATAQIEGWVLDHSPIWIQDFSVRF